jgi:hypothetical protein
VNIGYVSAYLVEVPHGTLVVPEVHVHLAARKEGVDVVGSHFNDSIKIAQRFLMPPQAQESISAKIEAAH